ncbi:MAG: DUF362 domain-containing protein [Candidatus Sumerlaeia bacterium]|nr:DUF362 domain-containing protein [Candidatus Sumerlaeia bacterium]
MEKASERSRREFLRNMALWTGAAAATAAGIPAPAADASTADLVVVSGEDPKAMVKKAIEELGGMKKFVSKGDVVVIKPNMAWERTPEQGANTNPAVVAGLVELALDAGAKEVKVIERTLGNPERCYSMSGIADAAKAAGAKILFTSGLQTATLPIKKGVFLKESSVWKDALDCDCYINVPVAKHHMMTQFTCAMKNHMGLTMDNRRNWHSNLDQAIADFASAFTPKLNVIDAYRVMLRGGPMGRSPQDLQMVKKCIVGVNQASVDAYGVTLFGRQPKDIRHVALAGGMAVGEIDLAKLKIKEVTV